MHKTKLSTGIFRLIPLMMICVLVLGLLSGCAGGSGNGGGNKSFTEKQSPKAGAVEVSTMDEFMKAIEPGAKIFLKDGTYNFQEWFESIDVDNWNETSHYVYLDFQTTGFQAIINGVDDLTISGESTSGVKLENEDTYADVLSFDGCHNISIDHITMGHKEAGYCTGDVLDFYDCTGLSLDTLDLYGCGTYGVTANYCHGMNVTGTTIRDCSYGIICIGNCTDINFKNCTMKDCTGYYMLDAWDSELLFEGCGFDGNGKDEDCEFIPAGYNKSVYFKDCSFGLWESTQLNAYQNHGDVVYDEKCSFKGSVSNKPVIVKSAEELIEAIEDGAMIILEPGTYNLSDYLQKQNLSSFNDNHSTVMLMDYFDGIGPEIIGTGISFTGRTGKAKDTTVIIDPRYAHCFSMDGSSGISFRGLTVGHTQTGDCDGAVMNINNSSGIVFSDCDLYGCGTVGIQANYSEDIYVLNTVVRDCSHASFTIYSCGGDFIAENSTFDGGGCSTSESYDMLRFFDRCKFGEWESNNLYFDSDIEVYDCEWHEITYYPDYSDYTGFSYDPDDFRYDLRPQRCDEMVFTGMWTGIQYTDYTEGHDFELPMIDESGDVLLMTLFINADGTAQLYNATPDPVDMEWYMTSDYTAILEADGLYLGSMGIYAAPEDGEEVPIYLMFAMHDVSIWFSPMEGE